MHKLTFLVLTTLLHVCVVRLSNASLIRTNRNYFTTDLPDGHVAYESLNSPIAIDWVSGLTFKQIDPTTIGIYSDQIYLKTTIPIPEKASQLLDGMASRMFVINPHSVYSFTPDAKDHQNKSSMAHQLKLFLAAIHGIVVLSVDELTFEVSHFRSIQINSDSVHFYPSTATSPMRIFLHQGRKSNNPYDNVIMLNENLCKVQTVEISKHRGNSEHIPNQLIVDNEHNFLYLLPTLLKNDNVLGRILQLNRGSLFLKESTFVNLSLFSEEHPLRLYATLSSIQPKRAVKFLFLLEKISTFQANATFLPELYTTSIPIELLTETNSTILLPTSLPKILNVADEIAKPSGNLYIEPWNPILLDVSFMTIPLTNMAPMVRFRDSSSQTNDYLIVTFYIPISSDSICKNSMYMDDNADQSDFNETETDMSFCIKNRRLYFLRVIPIHGCDVIPNEFYEIILKSPIHMSNALINPSTHCLYLSLVSKLPYNLLRLCYF